MCTTSASPHEVTLVEQTLDSSFINESAPRLIGDKAYDSDGLDRRLLAERGIELTAPNRKNRRIKTQDGRKPRQ
ncbi:MAG: transposase [Myxococcota bacterium]